MTEIEILIEKLYNYFNVSTINELARKIDVLPSTISNWKIRNSINAVKKKCRELGIYDEIFSMTTNNFQHSNNQIGQYNSNNSSSAPTIETNHKNSIIDVNSLKLLETLYTFAKDKDKVKELNQEFYTLLQKYM